MNERRETQKSLTIELSALELHVLETAASLSGKTLNDFALHALMLQPDINPNHKTVIEIPNEQFSELVTELSKDAETLTERDPRLNQKAPWDD